MFFQRGQRLRAHPALADDRAHAVPLDDLSLIRLLANAGRRARGRDAPALALFHDHRTAVIQHGPVQIDRRLVLHQIRMHGVASGEHAAGHHHDIADLQRPHRGFGQRRVQRDLAPGPHEAGLVRHRQDRLRRVAVQPAIDRTG